jgi:hypothetical protein
MADSQTVVAAPNEDPSPVGAHLAEAIPGRRFHAFEVEAGQRVPAAGHRRVLWLRDGTARVSLEGSWADEEEAAVSEAELGAGDLLQPGRDGAIVPQSAVTFWVLEIESAAPPARGELRRLSALSDTSGGCNPGENAFRRLQLTWDERGTGPNAADGEYTFGSHVVWIDGAKASPHYHPAPARGGGLPQHELYLILDPARFELAASAEAGIWVNPTPEDERGWSFLALQPGAVASIPAGVAHRGADILAIVVALPGFKPDNERVIGPPGAPAAAQGA